MKKSYNLLMIMIVVTVVSLQNVSGQTVYSYPLYSSFNSGNPDAPVLIQIPNNSGLTGEFQTRIVSATLCGEEGEAGGYFFEDDSGLQFDNPEEFIDQSYTISFNFQIDELVSNPPWVRILSFTHTDDIGIYIYTSSMQDHGTLEFWPYGYAGETNFFTINEYYQLTLVRNDEGMIKIYVNGENFAEYNDNITQKYVPQDPNNYIIWFRDHPSVLANEASSGFVSDILIANYDWTEAEIIAYWEEFCAQLLDVRKIEKENINLHPNPASSRLELTFEDESENRLVSILNFTGQTIRNFQAESKKIDLNIEFLNPGVYLLRIADGNHISYKKFIKK